MLLLISLSKSKERGRAMIRSNVARPCGQVTAVATLVSAEKNTHSQVTEKEMKSFKVDPGSAVPGMTNRSDCK
jgi:hypothetical protein